MRPFTLYKAADGEGWGSKSGKKSPEHSDALACLDPIINPNEINVTCLILQGQSSLIHKQTLGHSDYNKSSVPERLHWEVIKEILTNFLALWT